jgi:hypothetical protein
MRRLFPRCWWAFVMAGHTDAEAIAYLLEARRGSPYALLYLRTILQTFRTQLRLQALVAELEECEQ